MNIRRLCSILLAAAASLCLPGLAGAQAEPPATELPPGTPAADTAVRPPAPLFAADDEISLALNAPMRTLINRAARRPEVEGTVTYSDPDGTIVELDVEVRTRGHSRLEVCSFPPLSLNFRRGQVSGTLFAEQNRLKLVTQCSNRFDSAQHLELEYLSYQLYAAVAEVAFRVRPVRMRFVDTERNGRETSAPAFLLEHEDGVAARHGMAALAVPQVTSEALDVEAGATLALLQFLLGNTDWSVLGAADNEDCCHNSAILGPVGIETDTLPEATIVPVPYDFDQAGFINTSYALPSERLRIRRVTQRLYRGLCAHNWAVPQVAAKIVDLRPTIEALLTTSQRLDSAYRDKALEFLRSGFEILGNPELLASEVLNDCRGEAGGDA